MKEIFRVQVLVPHTRACTLTSMPHMEAMNVPACKQAVSNPPVKAYVQCQSKRKCEMQPDVANRGGRPQRGNHQPVWASSCTGRYQRLVHAEPKYFAYSSLPFILSHIPNPFSNLLMKMHIWIPALKARVKRRTMCLRPHPCSPLT